METGTPRTGYTLPVFACASAIAALRWLQEDLRSLTSVTVDLVHPAETAEISVESVARLGPHSALAITRSDPGDNLDLTHNTPIWAWVELIPSTNAGSDMDSEASTPLEIRGGEGIGRISAEQRPAIYAYARKILEANLLPRLTATDHLRVTLILPDGQALAERTSNAAFGVVEGLSLLGTSGISHPLSAPGQLEVFREDLKSRISTSDNKNSQSLVFCIGENGRHLAQTLGIPDERLIKTANWLGPLLVEAGVQGVNRILLFGYHGKLMKLAGGIFHTHHHVADGRREVLTSFGAIAHLPPTILQAIFDSPTAEAALQTLYALEAETGKGWVAQVYGAIAEDIDRRASAYIHTHCATEVSVGSVLFGRDRQIIVQSQNGASMLAEFC